MTQLRTVRLKAIQMHYIFVRNTTDLLFSVEMSDVALDVCKENVADFKSYFELNFNLNLKRFQTSLVKHFAKGFTMNQIFALVFTLYYDGMVQLPKSY